MRLRPFFSYYGSKWRLAPKYPSPLGNTIIEPFAGSACYSLAHPAKVVKLYDKYDKICAVWEYLIGVSEKEIRELPLIPPGETIPTGLAEEQKILIGFWLSKAATSPRKTMRTKDYGIKAMWWGETIRERIASQLKYIRHWSIEQASYDEIENQDACWFVDPPYQVGGEQYICSSKSIDFEHLGDWCRGRQGQVIVCERNGAKWLPFERFLETKGIAKKSVEAVWTKGE